MTKKRIWINEILIGIIGIFCISMSFSFAQSRSESEDIIKKACQTLEKSIKETYQGVGTARVLIYEKDIIETKKEKFLVDFTFKGEKSLAERYEINENGGKGRLLSATINTPEISFHYNGKENYAVRAHTRSFMSFYREKGYDFHPETFTRLFKLPFTSQMEMFMKYAKVIKIDSTNNSLLTMRFEGDKIDDEAQVLAILILDQQADFHPTDYKYSLESSWGLHSDNSQLKWKYYFSTCWYIEELKYNALTKIKKEKFPREKRVEIKILNFDPETKVEDSKFNFENLNIPGGTPVNDVIEKTQYKWGLK